MLKVTIISDISGSDGEKVVPIYKRYMVDTKAYNYMTIIDAIEQYDMFFHHKPIALRQVRHYIACHASSKAAS